MKDSRAMSLALALATALSAAGASSALAETVETTKTVTTTSSSGTVTEVIPSSTIIIRARPDVAPRTYTFSKRTVFVDPSGRVIAAEVTRGRPVTVYYTQEGEQLVASRVVVSEPAETTTETETRTEVFREIP